MAKPPKADPTLYPELRKNALATRVPGLPPDAVQAILMDWPVANGMTTVLAAADGTASIFLSSGESFTAEQPIPAIRSAALHAIRLAERDHGDARTATTTEPPASPNLVFFYFVYETGILLTRANESKLRDNTDRLHRLGAAMQQIITHYRLWHESRVKK